MTAYRAHFEQQNLDIPSDFFPPDMPFGGDFYVKAFYRLMHERPLSLGLGGVSYGRISRLAIGDYADREGLDADEFEVFDRIISAVDAEDVERVNEKANRKNK